MQNETSGHMVSLMGPLGRNAPQKNHETREKETVPTEHTLTSKYMSPRFCSKSDITVDNCQDKEEVSVMHRWVQREHMEEENQAHIHTQQQQQQYWP